MSNPTQSKQPHSIGGPQSRSSVGRGTGRLSRRLASASSLRSVGTFLRRQLWAWPLIAGVVLGGTGWLVHRAVEREMRDRRQSELTTIRDADVKALKIWMGQQELNVQFLADDEGLQKPLQELLKLASGKDAEMALQNTAIQESLRSRLNRRLQKAGYTGFFLVGPNDLILSADQDMPIGKIMTGYQREFFDLIRTTGPSVSKPFRSRLLLKDDQGEYRANVPTMFAAAPVGGAAGKVVAVLAVRIRPEEEFTRILQVARAGETGETYAFDQDGLMLSNSRYDADLKQVGLLPDLPGSQSVLTIHVRDPGVNMSAGDRPTLPRAEQPLTRMAASCVLGETGCDPDGYRDYRGVPNVGAWTWLPEYDFGVVTEMDQDEAFAPVYILRTAFWSLLGLLGLSSVGIFVAMMIMARQHGRLQAAVLQAKHLGQYTLEEVLGSGGMGTVYRSRHAMLRRPTAVKILHPARLSAVAIARFEREVQATCALTHPNTIQIFDFGCTAEGIFYYAMELLEGTNLDTLVARVGPLPEARVVYLLRQACGSLAEAHASGLVHRDVKPANLYLTRRGGMADFVKVLDFGLVKSIEEADDARLTSPNAVTGTPLYLSPEAVNEPDQLDARADVYALGAVAYYLLTATPVFSGPTVMDICMKQVKVSPESPSVRLKRTVSPALEALVLRCLAKSRDSRPANAGELLRLLDQCPVAGSWTPDDATAWWSANESCDYLNPGASSPVPTDSKITNGPESLAVTVPFVR